MSRKGSESKLSSETNPFSNVKDIFGERYYSINKRLLCYTGLWPQQSFFERSIRTTFVVFYTFCLFLPQTLQLIQSWGDATSFIVCFSPLATNAGCTIKLITFVYQRHKVQYLLDGVRDDWKCTHHLAELKILHEHGLKGMHYTIAYCTVVYTAVAAWSAAPLIPIVMDIISPLNESRPYIPYFAADYLVDPDKYFYAIYFHGFTATIVAMLPYVGIDTFFMMISQHVCGMLNVLRYRLENMAPGDNECSVRFDTDIQEDFYYRQIVACMIEHKRAVEYICAMEATCQAYLLLLIGLNMLCISCTCSQIVSHGTSTEDRLRFILFTIACVFHLFCNTLPGQWIMDTSSLLPNSQYSSNWYLMSPRSRRLIVLFIRRSAEPCIITAGKMYVMSMENFCGVLQTSMSYMTLLSSTQ